jgi:hypothetical protein
MGIVTGCAARVDILVSVRFKNVLFIVAVKTELLRLCDKEIPVPGAVRVVAHHATARGDRAVHDPFFDREVMAVETEILLGHEELV